jgi:predicted alpha/beta-hydrolase family hydrolase
MPDCLILTHGAGSNCDAPLLVAVDAALRAAGVEVLRINLPFRDARPAGPPRQGDPERDRQGLAAAVERAAREYGGRVFLGGHSYGGRQSSMLAAERPELASGLLLLSYPLHPPRRPDQMRTAHLPNLKTPALFVHGTRDPFGSIEELKAALALAPARTGLLAVEGAGHELVSRRAAALADISDRISAEFRIFVKS